MRLIYKMKKDGKTYYLWNKRSYEYELTTFNDTHVMGFSNYELDQILNYLTNQGYMPCELE